MGKSLKRNDKILKDIPMNNSYLDANPYPLTVLLAEDAFLLIKSASMEAFRQHDRHGWRKCSKCRSNLLSLLPKLHQEARSMDTQKV